MFVIHWKKKRSGRKYFPPYHVLFSLFTPNVNILPGIIQWKNQGLYCGIWHKNHIDQLNTSEIWERQNNLTSPVPSWYFTHISAHLYRKVSARVKSSRYTRSTGSALIEQLNQHIFPMPRYQCSGTKCEHGLRNRYLTKYDFTRACFPALSAGCMFLIRTPIDSLCCLRLFVQVGRVVFVLLRAFVNSMFILTTKLLNRRNFSLCKN